MAINVDTVYKTILLILNKEQRGYMTPEEFNKVGAQVQLEIFEKYFEDLNQLLRVPQDDVDYADRVAYLDQKTSLFKYNGSVLTSSIGIVSLPTDLHILGTVTLGDVEVQRVTRNDYYNLKKSPLTKPSTSYPIYLLQNNGIQLEPAISTTLYLDYIKKPDNPIWGYTVGSVGQYIYNSNTSTNFQLHESEQTEIVLRMLAYAGIIIKDPSIVQAAMAQVQQTNVNEKR